MSQETPSEAVPRRVAVVGAGLAGLAAAYQLSQLPTTEPTLFEASGRLGGTVETVTVSGATGDFVVECGPDAWVSEKPSARELAQELGLGAQLIYSNDALRRTYLAQNRPGSPALLPLPDGMRMMVPTRWLPVLESLLFSTEARLAYLREPARAQALREQSLPECQDEPVASFVRRHFGAEATRTVAGPLLAGVFGGDIEKLSAAAVLAPFVRMEREHGSLVKAVMERAQAKGEPPPPLFTTLRPGLGALVQAMAARLAPGTVRLHSPAVELARIEDGAWSVRTAADGHARFDAVILATPAHVTRELLAPLDREAAELLPVHASSAVVVALLWENPEAAKIRVPRGFGFLVPPEDAYHAETSLLAGTFMHQKFPHRAPPGAVFLRGFFGGKAAEQLMGASESEIVEAAVRAFRRILGPLPPPAHAVVRVWPRSLPQYEVGHPGRTDRLFARIAQLPGLRLVGNAYRGVGLPDLIAGARAAARELGV